MRSHSRIKLARDLSAPPPMSRWLAVPALILSAVGCAIAGYLSYAHEQLHEQRGWHSVCAISERLDCDTVLTSTYSTIWGLPLPVYGTWFYLILAALAGSALRSSRSPLPRSPALLLFALASFAALLSLALAAVSAAVIGSWCLFCAALYVVNFGLLGIAWRAVRQTGEPVRQAFRREVRQSKQYPVRATTMIAGTLGVLVLVRVVYAGHSAGGSSVCRATMAAQREGRPIDLIFYSDFQCPHCKAVDLALRPLRDRLNIVRRHYPLDAACNGRGSRHPGACRQASAALCAAAQGRAREFSDRLFDEGLKTTADLVDAATDLGLDRTRFEACLAAEATRDRLLSDITKAVANDVRATPTLFVNGQRHLGGLTSQDIRCLEAAKTRPTSPDEP